MPFTDRQGIHQERSRDAVRSGERSGVFVVGKNPAAEPAADDGRATTAPQP